MEISLIKDPWGKTYVVIFQFGKFGTPLAIISETSFKELYEKYKEIKDRVDNQW